MSPNETVIKEFVDEKMSDQIRKLTEALEWIRRRSKDADLIGNGAAVRALNEIHKVANEAL